MDKLITDNYDYLLTISKNITKRYKNMDKDIAYTLLHSCIETVYNTIDTSNEFLSDTISFRKYLTRYIKNSFEWKKQKCYSRKTDNDIFTYNDLHLVDNNDKDESSNYKNDKFNTYNQYVDALTSDPLTEQLIMLNAENVDDITKLYLKDLIVNDIPINRGLQYQSILDIAKSLDPLTYELFYLVYMEGKKVSAIHRELNKKLLNDPIEYKVLLQLVKEMKIKINEKMQCLK